MTPRGDTPHSPPAAAEALPAADGATELVAAIDKAWATDDQARAIHRTLTPGTSTPSTARSPLGRRR